MPALPYDPEIQSEFKLSPPCEAPFGAAPSAVAASHAGVDPAVDRLTGTAVGTTVNDRAVAATPRTGAAAADRARPVMPKLPTTPRLAGRRRRHQRHLVGCHGAPGRKPKADEARKTPPVHLFPPAKKLNLPRAARFHCCASALLRAYLEATGASRKIGRLIIHSTLFELSSDTLCSRIMSAQVGTFAQ